MMERVVSEVPTYPTGGSGDFLFSSLGDLASGWRISTFYSRRHTRGFLLLPPADVCRFSHPNYALGGDGPTPGPMRTSKLVTGNRHAWEVGGERKGFLIDSRDFTCSGFSTLGPCDPSSALCGVAAAYFSKTFAHVETQTLYHERRIKERRHGGRHQGTSSTRGYHIKSFT
jgi:hypothetical protein